MGGKGQPHGENLNADRDGFIHLPKPQDDPVKVGSKVPAWDVEGALLVDSTVEQTGQSWTRLRCSTRSGAPFSPCSAGRMAILRGVPGNIHWVSAASSSAWRRQCSPKWRSPSSPSSDGRRLAYKAGTSDVRESPSARVDELLLDLGAEVRGADPYVVDDIRTDARLIRVVATAEEIAAFDAVVRLTDHAVLDCEDLVEHATYVLDARSRLTGANVEVL